MREISHVARLDRSLASMIGQRPSPSHPIEPARAAQARPDTRTIWLASPRHRRWTPCIARWHRRTPPPRSTPRESRRRC